MNEEQLKAAYQALQLPEDASREEVEKKYFLLLKKSKAGSSIDVGMINQAYKTIMEHSRGLDIQQYEDKHYGNSKSRKAFDNFWSRYKVHVLVSIAVLIALAAIVNTVLDKRAEKIALSKLPPSALDVMFVGEFQQEDDEADLGEAMLTSFPEWKRIKTILSYAPETPKDQFDIAATQKNMLTLMTEIPDIYIMDRFNFEIMSRQNALKRLGTELDGLHIPEDRLVKSQSDEDDQAFVYGIDLSDSAFFKPLDLFGKEEKIIGLRFDTNNTENALLFIRRLLEAK